MKKLIFCFLVLSIFISNAQTKPVWIVFDKSKHPLKVYQEPIDCFAWMNNHNECSYQSVNLYYRESNDTTIWHPSNLMITDCTYHPIALSDKFLTRDTVYVIMQNSKETAHIADRVYQYTEDGQNYIDNFKLKFIKVPYLLRDKKSYDEIYRIKRKKLVVKRLK